MENELFKNIVGQGAWAMIFVWLLLDTRKESKNREEKYQLILNELADKYSVVEDIKDDVKEIKDDVKEIKIKLEGK